MAGRGGRQRDPIREKFWRRENRSSPRRKHALACGSPRITINPPLRTTTGRLPRWESPRRPRAPPGHAPCPPNATSRSACSRCRPA